MFRASLIAASTDSDPPDTSATRSRPDGSQDPTSRSTSAWRDGVFHGGIT